MAQVKKKVAKRVVSASGKPSRKPSKGRKTSQVRKKGVWVGAADRERHVKVNSTSVSKSKMDPKYGTSKLEWKFAKNFLEKLGIEYVYQYEMKPIGRFLDFFFPRHNIAIEVDGDYYHGYGLLYEEMSPMQKHNHQVDDVKNHWCAERGIKMIRIWEHDIVGSTAKVMKLLRKEFGIPLASPKAKKDKK